MVVLVDSSMEAITRDCPYAMAIMEYDDVRRFR